MFTANFERGNNGNDVLTTDPGSATAWNDTQGTPRPKYTNTRAAHGSFSAIVSSNDAVLGWNTSTTDHYGRLYFYATANPITNQLNLLKCQLGGTAKAYLKVNTTGKVQIADNGALNTQDSIALISLNQWIRIEWHIIHSATVGQMQVKLFNDADSITPTEIITGPATWDTGASCDAYIFADYDGTWGSDTWYDNIVANASSYPGPFSLYEKEVLADNPVGYWKFNELGGTNINNFGTNSTDLTTFNTPILGANGPIPGDSACAFTRASNEGAETDDAGSVFQTGDVFSVEFWYRPTTFDHQQNIYSKDGTGHIRIHRASANNIQLVEQLTGVIMESSFPDTNIGWHHWVLTKNGSARKVWRDGVDITTLGTNGTIGTCTGKLCIGNIFENQNFGVDGSLAHVAYYSTELSQARVIAHYNAAVTKFSDHPPMGFGGKGAGW